MFRICKLAACAAVLSLPSAPTVADDFLALVPVEGTAALPVSEPTLEKLTDSDESTSATFDVEAGGSVDLVFRFDEIVSGSTLVLTLAEGRNAPPGRVDVLTSTISSNSGFRSVLDERIDPLKPTQRFPLRPAATSWVMIRLSPAAEARSVTLADLGIEGTLGPPATTYQFGESPTGALQIIEGLAALGTGDLSLTTEEREIFDRAAGGALSREDFEEIALFASGIRNADARARYIARLDEIEAELRRQIDTNLPPAELAGQMLPWLHDKVLTAGYREKQTDLSVLLDEGLFNCVSSAVVYNALALRLGLDARAIEVPDHAFSIVYDGANHMDVETTTPQGFDPRREKIEAFEALTGFNYIPESNRSKRREIGAAGLAALIYYNHGVMHLREGRFHEALLANFRAMSLDPEFSSAATNALASLGKWSIALSSDGRWEEAVQVAALGRRLAPDDRGLASNQLALWQRWAFQTADAGDPAGALDLLTRAAAEIPEEDFAPWRAAIFSRAAETMIENGRWEAALAFGEEGLETLEGDARNELRDWHAQVYLRWSNRLMDAGAFSEAADVLAAGLAAYPDSRRIARNLRYLGQEWARAGADFPSGLGALRTMAERFPDVDGLDDVTESYVARALRDAAAERPIDDALPMAALAKPVLALVRSEKDFGAHVYSLYADALLQAEDWPAAAQIYADGLRAHPDDRHLKNNARFAASKWREAALAESPERLAEVTARLRELFPFFAKPGANEREIILKTQELAKAGDYAGALAFLNSTQLLLTDKTWRDLRLLIVDREAQAAMSAQDWEHAARVYSAARAELDDPKLFSNNVAYIAQEWTRSAGAEGGAASVAGPLSVLGTLFPGDEAVAEMGKRTLEWMISTLLDEGKVDAAKEQIALARAFLEPEQVRSLTITLYRRWGDNQLDRKAWRDALSAYATGLQVVPDSSDLKRNIPYVQQEWARQALAEGDVAGLLAAVEEMKAILPDSKSREDVVVSIVSKRVDEHLSAPAPEHALDLVNALSGALSADKTHDLKVYTYEKWARMHFESDWARAAEIYELGLTDVGKSSLLDNNLKYVRSKL
ncbi:hypothetical protein [Vannielia litorea]|uniref:hypothetical protein n=1 Tax=Vannielia litorea TaxID=1217970 RepID=UPI001BCC43E2|nr:hypothetical protein [Vannielia litorea]